MTLDPYELYVAELESERRWRPAPKRFLLQTVAGLGLRDTDDALYMKLWLVCDDAGTFLAGNTALAIRLGTPKRRPRKALERLEAHRLVRLFERDGVQYGAICHYVDLCKPTWELRPIHPTSADGGDPRPADGGVAEAVPQESPPTPPSIQQQKKRDTRAQATRARAREGSEGGAKEPHLRIAAHTVTEGDAQPTGNQLALAVEPPPPLPESLRRLADRWLGLFARAKTRPGYPAKALRQVTEAAVHDELRRMHTLYGIRALRDAVERIHHELNKGIKPEVWDDPLGNLDRKALWSWENLGKPSSDDGPEDCVEDRPEDVPNAEAHAEVVRLPPPDADPELATMWAAAKRRLQGDIDPWDFKHWIWPVTAEGRRDGGAVLGVPDESSASYMREQFGARIAQALAEVGYSSTTIAFEPWRAR